MVKVKICGITTKEEINMVNQYRPDYIGFIVNVKQSKRNCTIEKVKELSKYIDPNILKVGVFVDEDIDIMKDLIESNSIDVIQLHGNQSNAFIKKIKDELSCELIQAYSITNKKDILLANKSIADIILLDCGSGGTGKSFDWSLLQYVKRKYILAGGLDCTNIEDALQYSMMMVDVSSGVETNGKKDKIKIRDFIRKVRNYE